MKKLSVIFSLVGLLSIGAHAENFEIEKVTEKVLEKVDFFESAVELYKEKIPDSPGKRMAILALDVLLKNSAELKETIVGLKDSTVAFAKERNPENKKKLKEDFEEAKEALDGAAGMLSMGVAGLGSSFVRAVMPESYRKQIIESLESIENSAEFYKDLMVLDISLIEALTGERLDGKPIEDPEKDPEEL